ncbi:hypothetical protein C9374_005613 [Naegleria lovaniensis]|uniref:Uncharacterized protein n=1 Tax=Naegleria lovaniensis TaxID=51637 RepID=A0AA88GK24_NAELO|nr:uncharacterized protein C9374_005613 [Naegleria lovaniensis]KAG2382411.1 hypothetical protein C9374_005613 [Naegleria lovaniensis]
MKDNNNVTKGKSLLLVLSLMATNSCLCLTTLCPCSHVLISVGTFTYMPLAKGTITWQPALAVIVIIFLMHVSQLIGHASVLAQSYDFSNTVNVSDASGNGLINYPLQMGRPFLKGEIPNHYVPAIKLNGLLITSQAEIATRYEDGSVRFAVLSAILPKIEKVGNASLQMVPILNTSVPVASPCSISDIFTQLPEADISITLIGNGTSHTVSARNMISQGLYAWTIDSGLVRCEFVVVDHISRKADFGLNGAKSFRPMFVFTYYRTIQTLKVRAVLENTNLDTLQDVMYNVTVSKGVTSPAVVYSQQDVQHLFGSRWTKTFWFGAYPPESRVNFNYNVNYLSATNFIPNYQTNHTQTEKQISNYYSNWLSRPKGIFEPGIWQPYMPTTGMRDVIGLMPGFVQAWLTLGDWRYREISLTSADWAGAWRAHFREANPSLKWDRNQTLSALGKPISLNAHPALWFPDNNGKYAGALNMPLLSNSFNWAFEAAHVPDPFSIPYLLTGDSYYLESLQFWAAMGVMTFANGIYGRGATGYGGITDQVRGQAWTFRTRCFAALYSHDGSPEKLYFTQMVEDAIAFWEGQRSINGTFMNHPNRIWASKNAPLNWSPLRVWLRNTDTRQSAFWQEFFLRSVLGTMRDLGFPTRSILDEYHKVLTTQIGAPNYDARFMGFYWAYVMHSNLTWYQTWSEMQQQNTELQPSYSAGAVKQFETGDLYAVAATCASSFLTVYPNGAETWEFTRSQIFDKFDYSVNFRSFIVYPRSFAPPPPSPPSPQPSMPAPNPQPSGSSVKPVPSQKVMNSSHVARASLASPPRMHWSMDRVMVVLMSAWIGLGLIMIG